LGKANFIDAHTHLADPAYASEVDEILQAAGEHSVSKMLSNATDYQSSLDTIKLAKKFPHRVLAAVGVHPSAVVEGGDLHLEDFENTVTVNQEWVSAVGEIGLDGKYTQDERIRAKEKDIFRFFLGLAESKHLPVVVHSRQAVPETLDCLSGFQLPNVLLHWYDGPVDTLALLQERRYMISIGPALLYSRRITEIARMIDSDLILTETDGPVSYRGIFGNELTKPWFVIEVVNKLAQVRGTTPDTLGSTIYANFERFLGV